MCLCFVICAYPKISTMKKILLVILLSFVAFKGHAQNTFAPVGAEWWYAGTLKNYYYDEPFDTRWADHMVSVKDTTILNASCRMLEAIRYQKSDASPTTAAIVKRDTFYVYDNVDTVFIYDSKISNFTPLYIFNVLPGDTLCFRQPNSQAINPGFCIMIDSVVTELYDTTHLKSYYNHNISGSFTWGDFSGTSSTKAKYTEKIGGNWGNMGSFLPMNTYSNPEHPKDNNLLPTGSFRCYNDPGTVIKMVNGACDYIPDATVGIHEPDQSNNHFDLYPNPSTGLVTLESKWPFTTGASLLVSDISGREIKKITLPEDELKVEINLNTTQNGIYFLRLDNGKTKYYQKIIIQP
jgi:hypothetical protein